MHIIQPAAVARVADGWKLQAPGILEVREDQAKKKAPTEIACHQAETSTYEKAGLSVAPVKQESPLAACAYCGSLVETKYQFCWECGKPLAPRNELLVKVSKKPMEIMPPVAAEEEPTAQHYVVPTSSPIFSWAQPQKSNGALLKLIAVTGVGLVLVTLGLFLLTRGGSRMDPTTATQAVVQNAEDRAGLARSREGERNLTAEPTPLRTSTAGPVDDELKKLRERRIAAGASNGSAILEAFATAEKQYPNDYRFPYERAKLAIKASETHAHEEAFAALSLAAEKAINSGKAHEMLDSLEADKSGDFHKLSHGHVEWTQVEETLKSKEKNPLSE